MCLESPCYFLFTVSYALTEHVFVVQYRELKVEITVVFSKAPLGGLTYNYGSRSKCWVSRSGHSVTGYLQASVSSVHIENAEKAFLTR